MQKFKNWLSQKTHEHVTHREQTGNFISDYEENPHLRKRWLRVDIIGLAIFVSALIIMMTGIFDAEAPEDPPTLTPSPSAEPSATPDGPTSSPPTSHLPPADGPMDAMRGQLVANTSPRPAARQPG